VILRGGMLPQAYVYPPHSRRNSRTHPTGARHRDVSVILLCSATSTSISGSSPTTTRC
jgi:hypothetical protein